MHGHSDTNTKPIGIRGNCMFGDLRLNAGEESGKPGATHLADQELVKELASNTAAEVQAKRLHPRFTVALPVVARPANFSDRAAAGATGRTVDISQGGCMVIFEQAVYVGDVYAIDVDRRNTKLPLIYARCVRARMLHDDAIEAGFAFFTALDVTELSESMRRVATGGIREAAA
ncbi:MAG: PilZ domain-containing protein [Phycisphaerales bacterium]